MSAGSQEGDPGRDLRRGRATAYGEPAGSFDRLPLRRRNLLRSSTGLFVAVALTNGFLHPGRGGRCFQRRRRSLARIADRRVDSQAAALRQEPREFVLAQLRLNLSRRLLVFIALKWRDGRTDFLTKLVRGAEEDGGTFGSTLVARDDGERMETGHDPELLAGVQRSEALLNEGDRDDRFTHIARHGCELAQ